MKKSNFLSKLKTEKKLELVEQSNSISKSYGLKSVECKEERIDKQYYVTPMQNSSSTKDSSKELIRLANKFILEIESYKTQLKLLDIKKIREEIEKI